MDKKEIIRIIENFAPLTLAEEWDASGWVVETNKADINKIMLCLTVTDDIIRQAKDQKCDMIVSHHPLFFVPFEYKNIDIYCAHTNMDSTKGGTTDTIIKTLGFEISDFEHPFVRLVKTDISLEDFKVRLRKISPNFRYVNNKNVDTIKTIAFCAGSGSEFIRETDCDAYVTGDLKFHMAVESDKVLFDIGHFESEILVLDVFEKLLAGQVKTIKAVEKSPFIY